MNIKFSCNKHCADFEKTKEELIEQNQTFKFCPYCGEKFSIENLDDIVMDDLNKKTREHLQEYFNKLGIEATMEMIARVDNKVIKEMYNDLLRKKGLLK